MKKRVVTLRTKSEDNLIMAVDIKEQRVWGNNIDEDYFYLDLDKEEIEELIAILGYLRYGSNKDKV